MIGYSVFQSAVLVLGASCAVSPGLAAGKRGGQSVGDPMVVEYVDYRRLLAQRVLVRQPVAEFDRLLGTWHCRDASPSGMTVQRKQVRAFGGEWHRVTHAVDASDFVFGESPELFEDFLGYSSERKAFVLIHISSNGNFSLLWSKGWEGSKMTFSADVSSPSSNRFVLEWKKDGEFDTVSEVGARNKQPALTSHVVHCRRVEKDH